MTLHKALRAARPARWEEREGYTFTKTIVIVPNIIGRYRARDEAIRMLSRSIRQEAEERGYNGSIQMQTQPRSNLDTPLRDNVSMTGTIPRHTWYSSYHETPHWGPHCVPKSDYARTVSTASEGRNCPCAVCVHREEQRRKQEVENDAHVARERDRIFGREVGPARQEDRLAEQVQTYAREQTNLRADEGPRCGWCGQALDDGTLDRFTNGETQEVWHLRCAMDAAEST